MESFVNPGDVKFVGGPFNDHTTNLYAPDAKPVPELHMPSHPGIEPSIDFTVRVCHGDVTLREISIYKYSHSDVIGRHFYRWVHPDRA